MKEYYNQYYNQIKTIKATATEQTYRTCFKNLLNEIKINKDINIIQEAKRKKGFGAPDFLIEKSGAIIGYIETKKPGENLNKTIKSKQIKKYLELTNNLILTDYNRFMLFKNGDNVPTNNCELFDNINQTELSETAIRTTDKLFTRFFMITPSAISDSKELAIPLALRGKILKEYIIEILKNNEQDNFSIKICGLYETFKETLVKDLKIDEFADAYAQTVIYGLFLARLQSDKKITINNASLFIPSSFKVIKEFFGFISYDYLLPKQVVWIFKEICNLINNIDLKRISQTLSFGKETFDIDPYIYFYETFLGAFDPKKRKSKGVYYTPPQVVSFITRSVDKILTNQFLKPAGYADSSVTLLDFATGTGTFLVAVFELILNRIRKNNAGSLKSVICDHILKNFYGFEYLVAPYAIAHLKLSQLLKDNGYKFEENDRLQIYLTDTLDNSEHKTVSLFPVISDEGKQASKIKIDKPILVITGNPPYSNRSTGQKSETLIKDYKPKGEKKLNLNDDYIKFIRFAHNKMKQVKQGIIGIITNNSFLTGLTHRRMRGKLLEDFDKIYILNLHGSARTGETSPDGKADRNVFDIMQGVSINIFVKEKKSDKKCKVFYYDLYGKREYKYDFLLNNSIKSVKWQKLEIEKFDKSFKKTKWGKNRFQENLSFFVPSGNLKTMKNYGKFWGISEIFKTFGSGVKTDRDVLVTDFDKNSLLKKMEKIFNGNYDDSFVLKYNIKNSSSYRFADKLQKQSFDDKKIVKYLYRPFDIRNIYYKIGFTSRPAFTVVSNFLNEENIGLCFIRNDYGADKYNFVIVNNKLPDIHFIGGQTYIAPLYHINANGNGEIKEFEEFASISERQVNFTDEFYNFIKAKYQPQHPTPEEILGYIYAVMHCPIYRQTYLEFLKIDFPRIPFTDNIDNFKALSDIGWDLIQHHLIKKTYPDNKISFPKEGDDIVEKVRFIADKNSKTGNLFINKTQYFGNIPIDCWEFYIGGYQVINKWLKYRKGRVLTYQDKEHLKKIVNILNYTDKYMHKIAKIRKADTSV